MEVVPEPNSVSDCMKVFLDDPQWPKHITDPQLKQIKRRTSSNLIILDFFFLLVNYSCSLKRTGKNLVKARHELICNKCSAPQH